MFGQTRVHNRSGRQLSRKPRGLNINRLVDTHELGEGVRGNGETFPSDESQERLCGVGVGYKARVKLPYNLSVHLVFDLKVGHPRTVSILYEQGEVLEVEGSFFEDGTPVEIGVIPRL